MNEVGGNVQPVLFEQRGNVQVITLNRPHVHNAVDSSVSTLVGRELTRADGDRSVGAVVITGAGARAFCAGADLGALSRGEHVIASETPGSEWGFGGLVDHPISKPMIAAVNGLALGGGFEIALACDLIVAVERAQFGLPEVRVGTLAAGGGAVRLMQQIPNKLAMEFLLTGDRFSARRAHELGLVNIVVPDDRDIVEVAVHLAQRIIQNAPLALAATKRVARAAAESMHANAVARAELASIQASRDLKEGASAVLEKRKPVWEGR